jgi:S-DNA-T family DNA segregation ATPase FtsK/SpoIIIE
MPIELSIKQVREELLRAGGSAESGDGEPATRLLGTLFHEVFADLVSCDPRRSGLRVAFEAGPEDAPDRLLEHMYRVLVGPRLSRHQAHLQQTSSQVLVFWQAARELARWVAELSAQVVEARRDQPLGWEDIAGIISAEVALAGEIREPGWTDSVSLVGVADAIVRVPGRDRLCAVELKLGRAHPAVDLGQAALYRLLVSRAPASTASNASSASNVSSASSAPALALLRFSPKREEQVIEAADVADAEARLLDLIARVAGVAPPRPARAAAQGRPKRASSTQASSARATPAAAISTAAIPVSAASTPVMSTSVTSPPVISTPPTSSPAVLAPPSAAPAPLRYEDLGQKIVRALREYGRNVEIQGEPAVGPRFLRFEAKLGRGVTFDQIARLTTELGLKVGLHKQPIVSKDGGRLCIDIERPDPEIVPFSAIADKLGKGPRGSARVPVGVDLDGELHVANLASPINAHILVAGTTGSGKTEWLRTAVAGLIHANTPDTLRLVLIDPKLAAFTDLKRSPFLWAKHGFWTLGDGDVIDLLEDLVKEMDRRYQLLAAAGVDDLARYLDETGAILPRIVCFCDEYFALISQDRQQQKQIEGAIGLLGAKARAAGIHLVLATQQPSRQVIRGPLDANIPCRVGLMTQSAIESRMLLQTPGAERLTGYGDLLYKDVGEPIRLQAPYLSPADRARLFASA